MNTTTAARPALLHRRRIALTAGPAAAGQARSAMQAVIRAWHVPVDPDAAILLISEVVTNALRHAAAETIMLALTCRPGELRVDVHDTSRALPAPVHAPADAETGRGLMLVDSLSEEWGFYRTPAGKAVYFTLGF